MISLNNYFFIYLSTHLPIIMVHPSYIVTIRQTFMNANMKSVVSTSLLTLVKGNEVIDVMCLVNMII